jgi:hypothetical protein
VSFDTTWLDLREPADHAARDPILMQRFAAHVGESCRLVDLGSGTGSTVRALASVLPHAEWRLTDNDPLLLAEARRRLPGVETVEIDLANNLSAAIPDDAQGITASALIDLVSARWLDELVACARGRPLYIALSYDGIGRWHPGHPDDAMVLAAFDAHQRGDKGFGPALGPDAASYLARALHAEGYRVETAPSPWKIGAGAMAGMLVDGIAGAAVEAGVSAEIAARWASNRRTADNCEIGHVDLFAFR